MEKTMEKVFEVYIKTTPERLWHAITDTEMCSKYTFGAVVTSDWANGSRYEGRGHGNLICEGENLEVDPPRRLVQSFRDGWGEDVKGEGTSRVAWEIIPVGDSCRLTVAHDQLREGANDQLYGGWPMILSGLKTLLESGEMLTTPGSLRWLEGVGEHPSEVKGSITHPNDRRQIQIWKAEHAKTSCLQCDVARRELYRRPGRYG